MKLWLTNSRPLSSAQGRRSRIAAWQRSIEPGDGERRSGGVGDIGGASRRGAGSVYKGGICVAGITDDEVCERHADG